jgi:NDP-sugar pyrophosphorylase family protein
MNAMILAAGLGTRLGELGSATPKVLIDVGGRTLLDQHLEFLGEAGVRHVVINVHHRAAQVEAVVRAYDGPLEVECVHEAQLLGTAGGVRNVLAKLQPGPFLVLYGDIVVRDSINDMVNIHRQAGAAVTLAVHQADSATGKGVVDVDAAGRVTRFAEKEQRPDGPSLINSGIYLVETSAVQDIEPGAFSDFGQDVFPRLLAEGAALQAFRLQFPVVDIGTPAGLSLARELAGAGRHTRAAG